MVGAVQCKQSKTYSGYHELHAFKLGTAEGKTMQCACQIMLHPAIACCRNALHCCMCMHLGLLISDTKARAGKRRASPGWRWRGADPDQGAVWEGSSNTRALYDNDWLSPARWA